MLHLQRILFPVDLSEACRQFAPMVRSVACRTGAQLTLLNTLELPSRYESNPVGFTSWIDVRGLMRQQRSEFVAFHKELFGDVPNLNPLMKRGDPARRILEYSKKHQIDLIMMPTQGLGVVRRMLIGSVTAKVLHDAECAVWTAAHVPETPQTVRLSRILCAIDLSEGNVGLMRYAQGLAQTFGSQLRFLNVVPVSESWTIRPLETDFVTRLIRDARARMHSLEDTVDVKGDFEVRSGEIAHAVRREALEWQADLIVIGRGVLGKALGQLRSETYQIIRESPCQVVSAVAS
jgi:nucleotide-binding universal stress UspA family protein